MINESVKTGNQFIQKIKTGNQFIWRFSNKSFSRDDKKSGQKNAKTP